MHNLESHGHPLNSMWNLITQGIDCLQIMSDWGGDGLLHFFISISFSLLSRVLLCFMFDLMGRSNLPAHSKPAFLYYALLCPTNADIFLCSVIIQTTIITHFSCQLNSFFCEILYLKSDIFLPVYPLSKNCPMLAQNFFLLF